MSNGKDQSNTDHPESATGGSLLMTESGPHLVITTADLEMLLQQSDAFHHAASPLAAYDGHVTLMLEPGTLMDLETMHDALTSSHLLSDVPAIDDAVSHDANIGPGDTTF